MNIMTEIRPISELAMKKDNLKNRDSIIDFAIQNSWMKISPSWSLKNYVAVNPMSGFEDLPFKNALEYAQIYFQQRNVPEGIKRVNCEAIKWLKTFFDDEQAIIQMPNKDKGFLPSILLLNRFDKRIHGNDPEKKSYLCNLSCDPKKIIDDILIFLKIEDKEIETFFTLILTTLPGWASYIKYKFDYAQDDDFYIDKYEYLAWRLILIYLIWPEARQLLIWHEDVKKKSNNDNLYNEIALRDDNYIKGFIKKIPLSHHTNNIKKKIEAQFVFCIDVRSEPIRRLLELKGNYETYGIAGFFGVPIRIYNNLINEFIISCPVLLKPMYDVFEGPCDNRDNHIKGYNRFRHIKMVYQSLKYTFTTPFILVESMGFFSGLWMCAKNFFPLISYKVQHVMKSMILSEYDIDVNINAIPFNKKVALGKNTLEMIGMLDNFAPIVIFCGHGGSTQNNVYATSLDCGACGGNSGDSNARVIVKILNSLEVRASLESHGIFITKETLFLAAKHNTTTDEIAIYDYGVSDDMKTRLSSIKNDLEVVRMENNRSRIIKINGNSRVSLEKANDIVDLFAKDWAQVRPELGLANNVSFIVGPRWLTEGIDLEGRSFLHSYEWEKDPEKTCLEIILTAPMIVAQWINMQYLFSTMDNVSFGGGNKITQNVTGKIGVMQGNASDFMNGLPLQSVFLSDKDSYHSVQRLTVLIYAPRENVSEIVKNNDQLSKLFINEWIHLICYDPNTSKKYIIDRDLKWKNI